LEGAKRVTKDDKNNLCMTLLRKPPPFAVAPVVGQASEDDAPPEITDRTWAARLVSAWKKQNHKDRVDALLIQLTEKADKGETKHTGDDGEEMDIDDAIDNARRDQYALDFMVKAMLFCLGLDPTPGDLRTALTAAGLANDYGKPDEAPF